MPLDPSSGQHTGILADGTIVDGTYINAYPEGYIIIVSGNRVDKTIRRRTIEDQVYVDCYDSIEDVEIPLSHFAPNLYEDVGFKSTVGDPCPNPPTCGPEANRATIVRLPQQDLCCDDFDEEGQTVNPPQPPPVQPPPIIVDPGTGGGGEVNPPEPPPPPPPPPEPPPPESEACGLDENGVPIPQVGWHGSAGCGYPNCCFCEGMHGTIRLKDFGYFTTHQDDCCVNISTCAMPGIYLAGCRTWTAQVFLDPNIPCPCGGPGVCFRSEQGSAIKVQAYNGCASVCALGAEFRDEYGSLELGKCNCCPSCGEVGSTDCPCPLDGLIYIANCAQSGACPNIQCDPTGVPSCNCGCGGRKWHKKWSCCMMWRPPNSFGCNPECVETNSCVPNEFICAESCQPYLEINIAGTNPNGYYDDFGRYVGNCREREYVYNCCDCGQGGDDCESGDWSTEIYQELF